MKSDRRAKFSIFLVITVLALGLGNLAAVYTGDLVGGSLPAINNTDRLIALDDDNFSPAGLNTVYEEKKVVEVVNESADDNDTNSTSDIIEQNTDSDDSQKSNSNQNSQSNANDNSESSSGGSSQQSESEE